MIWLLATVSMMATVCADNRAPVPLADMPGPKIVVDAEGFLQCLSEASPDRSEDGNLYLDEDEGEPESNQNFKERFSSSFDEQAIQCHLRYTGVFHARDVFLSSEIDEMFALLYNYYLVNGIPAGTQFRNFVEMQELAPIRDLVLHNPRYQELLRKAVGGVPEFAREGAIELNYGTSNSGTWHRDVSSEVFTIPEFGPIKFLDDEERCDNFTGNTTEPIPKFTTDQRTYRFVFFLEDHMNDDGFRFIPGTHLYKNVTLQSGKHVVIKHRKTDVLVFDPMVVHAGNEEIDMTELRCLVHFTFGLAGHKSRFDRSAHEILMFGDRYKKNSHQKPPAHTLESFQQANILVSEEDVCKLYTYNKSDMCKHIASISTSNTAEL